MKRYTVVVCAQCQHVWIVDGTPDRSGCTRCGHTRKFKRLKKYGSKDSIEAARRLRTKKQTEIRGQSDAAERAFKSGSLFNPEETDSEEIQDELLRENGVDPEEVKADAESALKSSTSKSHKEIVLDAVSEDTPSSTESEIVEYASERGVPKQKTEKLLSKLLMNGEIIRTDIGFATV